MNRLGKLSLTACSVLMMALSAKAEVKVTVNHNDNDHATAEFKFKEVPSPSKTDAATSAKFAIVDGDKDENGGDLDVLHDGKLPTEQDEPASNFFFASGAEGGSFSIDLGSVIEVKQFNSYSWHPSGRGPQVYTLYGAEGTEDGFKAAPKGDPTKSGFKLISKVDTRSKNGEPGGQYGVSIADGDAALGKFRYLLVVVLRTEGDDEDGNTFFSEVDVIDAAAKPAAPAADGAVKQLVMGDGKFHATIDTTDTPDLTKWANEELAPVVVEWYPKLVEMLPSDGYSAPATFSITFHDKKKGVADTGGNRINCAADFFPANA